MEKKCSLTVLLFCVCVLVLNNTSLFAQRTVTFTATDNLNNHVALHHVVVENLTQDWKCTVLYPDTVLNMSGVGVENYAVETSFFVSENVPNPFDGKTSFAINMPYQDRVNIAVYDINGRKVVEASPLLEVGMHTFEVSLSTPQTYMLCVENSKCKQSIKLMNHGGSGANSIAYQQFGPLGQPNLEHAKNTTYTFEDGDIMRYVGYMEQDGMSLNSDTIEQPIWEDTQVSLMFQIWYYSGLEAHYEIDSLVIIPDGFNCGYGCTGAYEFNVSAFDSTDTVSDVNDIKYVRLKMEHSYLGDLWIGITCPNGQKASILKAYTPSYSACGSFLTAAEIGWMTSSNISSGVQLGVNYDDLTSGCDTMTNPVGTCWNYCWSVDTVDGFQYANGSAYIYETCNHISALNPNGLAHGKVDSSDVSNGINFYHPDDPFTSLIGCPMNGVWTVEVLDKWSADNGYIREAKLVLQVDSTLVSVFDSAKADSGRCAKRRFFGRPGSADATPSRFPR